MRPFGSSEYLHGVARPPFMHIDTHSARIWVHQQGDGPAVFLIGGTGDPAESWQAQIDAFSDRYRVVAPDNRGAGRSSLPASGVTISAMAEDAAEVLRSLGIVHAHVAGFSMGGAIAQELAITHPDLVGSLVLSGTWSAPDAYFRRMVASWIVAARNATSERELLESFYLWIYSREWHEDGTVDRLIVESLESPLAQDADGFFAQAQACVDWAGAAERLRERHHPDARDRRRRGHRLPAAPLGTDPSRRCRTRSWP